MDDKSRYAVVLLLAMASPVTLEAFTLRFAPEAGTNVERVGRTKVETRIIDQQTIRTQTIETGTREVGQVMDTAGGETRIASQALQSALKVNGQVKPGGVPGAGDIQLRVYSSRGELLRAAGSAGGLVEGDLRDLAVRLPAGEVSAGEKWRQTFVLPSGEGAEPLPIEAEFELVGPRQAAGRDGYEIRGTLRLDRKWSQKKMFSAAAIGKASCIVDAKTGLPLRKTVRLKAENVREDPISRAYVKAGGQKLGYYVEMTKDEQTTYVGPEEPPALTKARRR